MREEGAIQASGEIQREAGGERLSGGEGRVSQAKTTGESKALPSPAISCSLRWENMIKPLPG